jgi:putative FmdB family regulatory protein
MLLLKVDLTLMPLYEYQCDACEHRFEKIQKFSDPLVDVCPKCGGAVKKLVSSPAIQFKGSGFYITDYARKSSTDASSSKSSSEKSDKTEKSEKSEKSSDTSSSSDSSSSPATATSTTPSKD